VTEKDLIATAYFYHSTNLLRQVALIIGEKEDAAAYQQLATNIKTAFANEYITELIEKSARYFAADVEKFKHLTTGFLGTPLLCSTLSKIGRDDLAFMLLNRKEYPSWLYPVTQGATTIWERWDTQKPDGTIIEGMNSFNHYAYGAVGDWKMEGGRLNMKVTVPSNTTANIYIPASAVEKITESGTELSNKKEIEVVGQKGDYVMVKVGSGHYDFIVEN